VQEIVPGIFHWTAFHDGIGMLVSSYYVASAGAVIDPMVPGEGLEAFDEIGAPRQAILTTRHHYRHCDQYVERFGVKVVASEPGLHEFEGTDRRVEGFRDGDEPAPGITAILTDAISPDDTTLHIAVGSGALAFADGLVRPPGAPLMVVPDFLIGDEPGEVKEALREAYRGLLERDLEFDALLFAHGEPLVGGARAALSDFVSNPIRSVDFGSAD
jgi:hypothetical protein